MLASNDNRENLCGFCETAVSPTPPIARLARCCSAMSSWPFLIKGSYKCYDFNYNAGQQIAKAGDTEPTVVKEEMTEIVLDVIYQILPSPLRFSGTARSQGLPVNKSPLGADHKYDTSPHPEMLAPQTATSLGAVGRLPTAKSNTDPAKDTYSVSLYSQRYLQFYFGLHFDLGVGRGRQPPTSRRIWAGAQAILD